MALTVEDGSIVEGANSFAALDWIAAYLAARGDSTFQGRPQVEQEAAAVRAADYLSNEGRFPYRGTKRSLDQLLPWPRTGATEVYGQPIPDTTIPVRLKAAQAELAKMAIAAPDLQPPLERGGRVQTKTVGPLTTTWFPDAPSETTIPAVWGLLKPLLRPALPTDAAPVYSAPVLVEPFGDSDFRPPGV